MKNPVFVWDECENCAWVNSLIKLRLYRLLFTQHKTSWLVRMRLCRLVGIRIIIKVYFRLLSEYTEFKATFLWRLFMIHVLSFCKPAWYSNFSNLSDSRVHTGLLVWFMYDERSPWKNQQRQARSYCKGESSLCTRSQSFPALVSKWHWQVLISNIKS